MPRTGKRALNSLFDIMPVSRGFSAVAQNQAVNDISCKLIG